MAIKSISCDPAHDVKIVFRDSVAAVFEDTKAKSKAIFAFPMAASKFYRFDCGRLSANNTELSLQHRSSDMYATLSAQNGLGSVQVTVYANGRQEVHDLQNVSKMTVGSRKITVVTQTPEPPPARTPPTTQTPPAPETDVPMQTIPSHLLEGLKASVAALRKDCQRLTAEKNAMESALNHALGEQITLESDNMQNLSRELQEKLDTFTRIRSDEYNLADKLNQAQEQLLQAQARRDSAQEKYQDLQQQLAALRSQEESATLDCEDAAQKLEALKIRLGMDSSIIELSESRWLKNNSVLDTLKELEQKIQAIENRLCLIINAREIYNGTVQGAIMRENDGTISMDDENSNRNQDAAASDDADLN